MFYSAQILAKKGPLGTVWIAAHIDKKLKRHQIFETSIPSSVGATTPYATLRAASTNFCCQRDPRPGTLPRAPFRLASARRHIIDRRHPLPPPLPVSSLPP